MNRTERIARLSVIPLLLLLGILAFNEYRQRDSASVSAETETETTVGFFGATTTTPGSASSSDGSTSSTDAGSATTDPSASGPSTTTAGDGAGAGDAAEAGEPAAVDLPEADPAAPPQEPAGVYSDGKLVLRGSVPDSDLAAGYLERAGSVLGEDNVTMEMTLDPRVQGESMTIEVQEQFRFPEGAVTFDPRFEALLDLGAAALQLLPEATLVVTGHTDDRGTDATNIALSQARAQVVVDWMIGKGIDPARVIARGAGESEPTADNATPEGREANRRIEAVLEGVRPA